MRRARHCSCLNAGMATRRVGRQRPSFHQANKYSSFTLKQADWKRVQDDIIRLDGRTHTCALSGPIDVWIKTVTIKRDAVADVWVCVACEVEPKPNLPMTG